MKDLKVKIKFRNYKNHLRDDEIPLSELNIYQKKRSKKIATNFDMFNIFNKKNPISTDLVSIELPEGIETIKESAFRDYKKIETVILPKSLKTIENSAFRNCEILKMPKLPSNLKSVGPCAFSIADYSKTIKLPKNLTFFEGSSFKNAKLIINPKSAYFYQTEDGVIYTKDKKQVVWVPYDKKTIEIADGTKIIQSDAFGNRKNLKNIKMPDSIEMIESYAFSDCTALEVITISSNLRSLEENVFLNCYNLKKIIIPKNVSTHELLINF